MECIAQSSTRQEHHPWQLSHHSSSLFFSIPLSHKVCHRSVSCFSTLHPLSACTAVMLEQDLLTFILCRLMQCSVLSEEGYGETLQEEGLLFWLQCAFFSFAALTYSAVVQRTAFITSRATWVLRVHISSQPFITIDQR